MTVEICESGCSCSLSPSHPYRSRNLSQVSTAPTFPPPGPKAPSLDRLAYDVTASDAVGHCLRLRVAKAISALEEEHREAISKVRQDLAAAFDDAASKQQEAHQATIAMQSRAFALRSDELAQASFFPHYEWMAPLLRSDSSAESDATNDFSDLPPLIDHNGKVVRETRPSTPAVVAPSIKPLAPLDAQNGQVAYDRLVARINRGKGECLIIEGNFNRETKDNIHPARVLTNGGLPLRAKELFHSRASFDSISDQVPLVVSPSSSTVTSQEVKVNLPTLTVSCSSTITKPDTNLLMDAVMERSLGDSDESDSEAGEADSDSSGEVDDCSVGEEGSVLSKEEAEEEPHSDDPDDEDDEDDEDDGEEAGHTPSVAELQNALLKVELRWARLEFEAFREKRQRSAVLSHSIKRANLGEDAKSWLESIE